MQHILTQHHPEYWNGTVKSTQTFFDPAMSVASVRALAHDALRQWPATLASKGTKATFTLQGTTSGVKYTMTIVKGRVVQFYPR